MKAKGTGNLSFAIEWYSKIHFVGDCLDASCQIHSDFHGDVFSGQLEK